MPKKETPKVEEVCEKCQQCKNECKYTLPAQVYYCPKFSKKK